MLSPFFAFLFSFESCTAQMRLYTHTHTINMFFSHSFADILQLFSHELLPDISRTISAV